jgi:chromosomal replication initiation ATPase DnaA
MPFKQDAFSQRTCRVIARLAKEIVCEAYAVSHAELLDGQRGSAQVAQARHVAMYLAHVVGQLTLNEVAIVFKKSRTTVSHCCTNIEDRRDSPIFDLQIEFMEKRLRERINDFRSNVTTQKKPRDCGEIFSRER